MTGQVVQVGTTTGIPSASLLLVDSTGNAMTTVANAAGAFSFPVTLASGTYTLQTVAPGYVVSIGEISIPVNSLIVQLPLVGTSPVTSVAVNINGQAHGQLGLTIGQTTQLTATVLYSDGTQKNVTTVAKWSTTTSSTTTSQVAAVSISGVMTAFSAGTTTVTASFQDVTGTLNVTVSSP